LPTESVLTGPDVCGSGETKAFIGPAFTNLDEAVLGLDNDFNLLPGETCEPSLL
jgi:hypothetical protein